MSSLTNCEKFCWYLHDMPSPRHFLRWNYYFSISSILARKVWLTAIDDDPLFPNIYLVITGPPGIGKSRPSTLTKNLLNKLKESRIIPGTEKLEIKNLVNFSPDSMSVERLIESLAQQVESIKICDVPKKFYIHSSMTFYITEELTTLFKAKQEDLVDFLTAGWNCGSFKRELKTNSQRFNIANMCINFLGCTTAERLSKCVNTELISQGFTARTLFLYGDSPYHKKAGFEPDADQRQALKEVEEHWKKLGKVFGQVLISHEAKEWLNNWLVNSTGKINNNKYLEDYYGRKDTHLKKMAMICHFAEKTNMTLDVEDFEVGLKQLELIEIDMHKSLKGLGRNPIHTLAENISRGVGVNGGMSYKKILATYFDGGNAEEIKLALEHKMAVGAFRTYEKNGQVHYQLQENVEEESH